MSGKTQTNDVARVLATRATELLGDGEWHDYEPLRRELMKLVPPGIALRKHRQTLASAEAQRRRQGSPPGPRHPERPTDDRIRSGRKEIVGDFLRNDRVFEFDRKMPVGARPVGAPDDRKIRMIGAHRLVAGNWQQLRADRLQREVDQLRAQVMDLRKYLVEIGESDAAERLAP